MQIVRSDEQNANTSSHFRPSKLSTGKCRRKSIHKSSRSILRSFGFACCPNAVRRRVFTPIGIAPRALSSNLHPPWLADAAPTARADNSRVTLTLFIHPYGISSLNGDYGASADNYDSTLKEYRGDMKIVSRPTVIQLHSVVKMV